MELTRPAAGAAARGERETVLELDHRPLPARQLLADMWRRRDLLMILARKDFYVRYRRSWLGLFWVVLVPLAQAGVMAFVFSHIGRFSQGADHYPVYVFSGFMAWSFFSSGFIGGATAIVDGKDLAARIYFPRALLPIVKLLTDGVTLVTSMVILVVVSLLFGVPLGLHTLLLIPAMLLIVGFTLGFTLVLSALHVHFRDIRFIVSTVILPWFYITPILYAPTQITGPLSRVIRLNPATGVIDLVRAGTLGAGPWWQETIPIAVGVTVVLLVLGIELQRRFDRTMTDLL